MARDRYSQERLARLLRLLQPAPNDWVRRAQRSIADLLRLEPLSEHELTGLHRMLERDPSFRQSFDLDPVAATDTAGWPELARTLQREFQELIGLAERIAADDAYHRALHADVLGTLHAADVPLQAAEPLLRALAEPDALLAKLPEVVAHQHERESARLRRLILLLSSTVVADTLRDRSRRD